MMIDVIFGIYLLSFCKLLYIDLSYLSNVQEVADAVSRIR